MNSETRELVLDERKVEALRLYLKNGSIVQTADELNVSRWTIHRWLSDNPLFVQKLSQEQSARISASVDEIINQFEQAVKINGEALAGEKITRQQENAIDRTYKYLARHLETAMSMGAAAETLRRLSSYLEAYREK